jgi:Fe-S-cluster containining protein
VTFSEDEKLVAQWFAALERTEIMGALAAIAESIALEVEARRPICLASGRCCGFERHGHRLYATGLETAWCVRSMRARRADRALPSDPLRALAVVDDARVRGDCPFLVDGRLCGAHLERPFGCRVYYCDGAGAGWQEALAERSHRTVVRLHEEFELPYRYGEWRSMLALVSGVPSA